MKWLKTILARWTKPPGPLSPAQIKRQVERRRRRAEATGLTSSFVDLAQNVFYYPSWISHSRNAVPALISQAREIEHNHVQLITSTGHTMDFQRKPGPSYLGDYDATATVELYIDGILSFAIDVA
ncbi:MAG: hypothetical protein HYX25_11090, partial [Candidatus Solibacter usitatus]|nr:hypothetical protein [Candidatus Solibacter usitatus]